jgi:hypothetical protein
MIGNCYGRVTFVKLSLEDFNLTLRGLVICVTAWHIDHYLMQDLVARKCWMQH